MKILVTGANGLIGRKVIRDLLKRNDHQIIATSQKRVQFEPDVDFFTVNLVYSDLNKLVDTLKPDVLIHCAALSSPDACEVDRYSCRKLNVEVTSRLAAACRDYDTHLILLSTDFVFDGKNGGYSETDPASPILYYGESKVEAEKIITDLNIGATIVRTSLVFGYEENLARPNIAVKIIEHLKKGKSYKTPFDQIRTPTFAEDLASSLVSLAENRMGGIFHIAGGEVVSVYDFSVRIANIFGFDESLLIPTSTKDLPEPALRPLNTSLVIQKAKNVLGYNPTPLNESIHSLKEQYKLI